MIMAGRHEDAVPEPLNLPGDRKDRFCQLGGVGIAGGTKQHAASFATS